MSTGSEYISPAEDWYRGQHRQQQERSHERHDELQFRDPIVSYSLSNERHRSILPHQQNYAHFYPQTPFPPTNQYSLSSFDSHELYVPRPVRQDQYQQHIQLPLPHSYVSHSHADVQPSPYSSQRVFPDDAYFSPSQYSPASSAANTPFLHHSSSQPVSQSFYHQQITLHEEIQQVQYREHPGDQDQRDYDASPPYPHQRSYDAQRQPLFGYDQEPTLAQGYFPLVDSEGYQSIADDSHCSSSPSPPIPDYIPICSSRSTLNIISPIPHRHIYEDPSNNYHPSTPSPSPSPGPSTQHESAFHVAQAQVEDYPSPEDEDRFKTAPASRSLSPLTDLEDLVEEEVDAGDPAFEADPDEEKEEARFEASAVRSSRRHPPAVRTQAPRLPRSTAPSPEEGEVSLDSKPYLTPRLYCRFRSILLFSSPVVTPPRSSLTFAQVRSECLSFHRQTRLDSPPSYRVRRYDLLEVSRLIVPRMFCHFYSDRLSRYSVELEHSSPSLPPRRTSSTTYYRRIYSIRAPPHSSVNST